MEASASSGACSGTEISVPMDALHPATECFGPVIERWQTVAGQSEGLPFTRDFQADHLSAFQSRVSVIEPVENGKDFKFVIYAGAIIDAGGIDMTGYQTSDFHDPEFRAVFAGDLKTVLKNRRPGIWRYRHEWRGTSFDYCCLHIPLQHGDGGNDRIHSITMNTDPARRQLYSGHFQKIRKAVKPDQEEASIEEEARIERYD